MLVPMEARRRCQIPWNWNCKVFWAAVWVPGFKSGFLARAARAFNCWANSPACPYSLTSFHTVQCPKSVLRLKVIPQSWGPWNSHFPAKSSLEALSFKAGALQPNLHCSTLELWIREVLLSSDLSYDHNAKPRLLLKGTNFFSNYSHIVCTTSSLQL